MNKFVVFSNQNRKKTIVTRYITEVERNRETSILFYNGRSIQRMLPLFTEEDIKTSCSLILKP